MPAYPTRPRPRIPAGVVFALIGLGLYLLLVVNGLILAPTPGAAARLAIAVLGSDEETGVVKVEPTYK